MKPHVPAFRVVAEARAWLRARQALIAGLTAALAVVSAGKAAPSEAQQIEDSEPTAAIGSVVDAGTLAPLANVLVAVQPAGDTVTVHSRLTDDNGDFHLPRLEAGRYTVMFSLTGYTAVVRELVVPAEPNAPVDMGPVALPPRTIDLPRVDVITNQPVLAVAAGQDIHSVDAMAAVAGRPPLPRSPTLPKSRST